MLVVGVTCTLSSRSFLFSPSCYVPAKFNVPISFAVAFLQPFEPRHSFLSIGYRSSSSSSLSMSPRFRHCPSCPSPDPRSRPFSGFNGSSLDSRSCSSVSVSAIIVLFSHHPVPAQPGFYQHHRLLLSRHFFLCSRYPVSLQPNLLFRS
jgi:hypothetical protein